MPADENIGFIAALINEPSRAAILMSLMDGSARPAGELAHLAGITPQTASWHLSRLAEGGLVSVGKRGRHRFFRLAGPEIAKVLESLLVIVPKTPLMQRRLKNEASPLRFARTCYDHLAGRLGVRITKRLMEIGVLVDNDGGDYDIGDPGWLKSFGIDLDRLRGLRRVLAKPCLDWTERQSHLGGALGAEILTRMMAKRWLIKSEEPRVVRLSRRGRQGLFEDLAIDADGR